MHGAAMVAFEIILAIGLPVDRAVAILRQEIMLLFERIIGRHGMDRTEPFDEAGAAALQPEEDEAAPFLGVDRVEAPGVRIEDRVGAEIGRLVQATRRAYSSSYDRGRREACRSGRSLRLRAARRDGGRRCERREASRHRRALRKPDSRRRFPSHNRRARAGARTRKTASSSWRISPAAPARTARDRDSPVKEASSRIRLWLFGVMAAPPSRSTASLKKRNHVR